MSESTIRIAALFPDLLGTYGDGGNAVVLHRRLQWRGIASEIISVPAGASVPDSCDLYLVGGGEDGPQTQAARELRASGALHRAVDSGAVVLAVCAGMQILGHRFPDATGAMQEGLGLLDCTTSATDAPRAVGELLTGDASLSIEGRVLPLGRLTGFENHAGRTTAGATASWLATVDVGIGNGDGSEGIVNGRVVGTYLHGPALARNPALADALLTIVLDADLEPLDDREIDALRGERIHAAMHRRSERSGRRERARR